MRALSVTPRASSPTRITTTRLTRACFFRKCRRAIFKIAATTWASARHHQVNGHNHLTGRAQLRPTRGLWPRASTNGAPGVHRRGQRQRHEAKRIIAPPTPPRCPAGSSTRLSAKTVPSTGKRCPLRVNIGESVVVAPEERVRRMIYICKINRNNQVACIAGQIHVGRPRWGQLNLNFEWRVETEFSWNKIPMFLNKCDRRTLLVGTIIPLLKNWAFKRSAFPPLIVGYHASFL